MYRIKDPEMSLSPSYNNTLAANQHLSRKLPLEVMHDMNVNTDFPSGYLIVSRKEFEDTSTIL